MNSLAGVPDKIIESRKLMGFAIALACVLVMMITFIICSAFLGTPWGPFQDLLTWVAAITGMHQTGQTGSDIMKWRATAVTGQDFTRQQPSLSRPMPLTTPVKAPEDVETVIGDTIQPGF